MGWVTKASDDFFRANEIPLGGNWGAYASAAGNRWNLVSNGAKPSNLGTDMVAGWNARSWAQDHSSKCQVYVTGTGADTGPGPCVRFIEGTHTTGYYLYRLVISKAASNNAVLDRASNGTFTTDIAHWTVAHVDGDTYTLQVQGLGASTVLTVLRNDAQFGQYSDGSGLSGVGMPAIAYSSTTTEAIVDDFVGAEYESSSGETAFLSGIGW